MKKSKIKLILGIIVAVLLIVTLVILLWPLVRSLSMQENREAFKKFVEDNAVLGFISALLLQVAQVVIAIIPGEPIELLLGFLYGTVGGLVVCLIGVTIGTIIIYLLVNKFGRKLIDKFFPKEKINQYKFLNNPLKVQTLLFMLYFIPGTPKDLLTYMLPILPIKPVKAVIIAVFARIPSVVTSTLAGALAFKGQWIAVLIVYAVIAIISVAGIILNNKIANKNNIEEEI